MKNWTAMCQEIAYVTTGKVFTGAEWTATSDRGAAILAMATQRGDVVRVVLKAFDTLCKLGSKLAEELKAIPKAFYELTSRFMVPVMFLEGPKNCNYASAWIGREHYGWSPKSSAADKQEPIAPPSMPVVISSTS